MFLFFGSKSVSLIHCVGMKNGSTASEKDVSVSYKTKHTPILRLNSIPRYLPKRNKNIDVPQGLQADNHSSFIHKSHKLETAQVFINR